MMQSTQMTVTQLLHELEGGNKAALSALFPLLYTELQTLARRQRRRWRGDFTLNTTALVNEAYLKLVDQRRLEAGATHFFAVAAKTMRHILCNYARDRLRKKRGGHLQRLSLADLDAIPENLAISEKQSEILVALDNALRRLEQEDRSLSDIVECRFFGAMSIAETATALGLSPATVKRHWTLARSWLYRELQNRAAR